MQAMLLSLLLLFFFISLFLIFPHYFDLVLTIFHFLFSTTIVELKNLIFILFYLIQFHRLSVFPPLSLPYPDMAGAHDGILTICITPLHRKDNQEIKQKMRFQHISLQFCKTYHFASYVAKKNYAHFPGKHAYIYALENS